MGPVNLDDILITPLNQIELSGGNVLHAIKKNDRGFHGFGEAYFSSIETGAIKAWKLHTKMSMNLIVPIGYVRFVFCLNNKLKNSFRIEEIGNQNYSRITVPPGIWFGFRGLSNEESLILNIANLKHNSSEVSRLEFDAFTYDWENEN